MNAELALTQVRHIADLFERSKGHLIRVDSGLIQVQNLDDKWLITIYFHGYGDWVSLSATLRKSDGLPCLEQAVKEEHVEGKSHEQHTCTQEENEEHLKAISVAVEAACNRGEVIP